MLQKYLFFHKTTHMAAQKKQAHIVNIRKKTYICSDKHLVYTH